MVTTQVVEAGTGLTITPMAGPAGIQVDVP